ncbi:MAG TPA: hypothetical protein VFD31_13065 [Thermoleophilaceae bacterium]|nr:hypothetical protein [Thermoleophilaceae bacterium]
MTDLRRLDVGFQGGQVLAVRIEVDAYDALVKALANDRAERWHQLDTDDSQVQVDLSQVVYVQRESGNQKVGF